MKYIYYLVFILLFTNSINAQDFFPKSPDISSIGRYVDTPISLGTGNVDYKISLENLNIDNNIIIPISIRYNTNGIKVNEEANNIGLNWSLATNSFITRNIKGLPDNYDIDLRIDIERIKKSLNSNPGTADYHWLEQSLESGIDSEPDEFIVNIFDHNFRFYYNYDTKRFQSIPKNEYIISGDENGFKIVDIKGNQYFFGYNTNSIRYNPYTVYISEDGTSAGNPLMINKIDTWYLEKIITKDKNIVEFIYEKNNGSNLNDNNVNYNNVNHISQYMYVSYTNNFFGNYNIYSNDLNKVGSIYPISDQLVNDNKIDIIKNIYSSSNREDLVLVNILINDKKRVDFIKSKDIRLDLDNNQYKLEEIIIYDFNEIINKSFKFNQSYYNQEFLSNLRNDCSKDRVHPFFKNHFDKYSLRLRLDGIDIRDELDNKVNDYKFYYYEGELPSRLSYSQDLYGYYNGQNNCSLIPPISYNYYFFTGNTFSSKETTRGDSNRKSDINYNKIGALKKVIYPTNGSIEFEYENHIVSGVNDYNEYEMFPVKEKKQIDFGVEQSIDENGNLLPNPDNYIFEFEMTNNVSGQIYTYLDTNRNNYLESGPDMYTVVLEKLDANGDVLESDYLTNGNSGMSKYFTIGKYRINASRNSGGLYYDASLGYIGNIIYYDISNKINNISSNDLNEILVGGLRINKIVNRDNNNHIISHKEYDYKGDNGISTGVLYGYPIVKEIDYYKEIHKLNGVISYPFKSLSNSTVVYSKVSENNIDNNKIIKKEYYFKSGLGEIGESNSLYRISSFPFYWRKNLKTKENYYLGTEIVQSVEYKYSTKSSEIKDNYGVRLRPKDKKLLFFINSSSLGSNISYYTDFEYEFYPFNSEYQYVSSIKSNELFLDNILETETTHSYDSPNHLQLTKLTTKNSKGDLLTTEYTYPQDIPTYPNMDKLISQNRIGEPVITKQKVGDFYVASVYNEYNVFNEIVNKSRIFKVKGRETFTENDVVITYDSYDNYGNITQYTPENGIPVSIIWGYNGQYPILKVEGVKLGDIPQDLIDYIKHPSDWGANNTELSVRLNYQRNEPYFKDAMVTGYVYKPLVGVTEIIQPNGETEFYEYDSANRLKSIKNNHGEIIKTFEYNYANTESEINEVINYYNEEISYTVYKQCGSNQTTEPITYTIPAGKYSSTISVSDANTIARNSEQQAGQDYANSIGVCKNIYFNEEISYTVYKQCGSNQFSEPIIYTIPAGRYSSTVSVSDANNITRNSEQQAAQDYANIVGKCSVFDCQFTKTDSFYFAFTSLRVNNSNEVRLEFAVKLTHNDFQNSNYDWSKGVYIGNISRLCRPSARKNFTTNVLNSNAIMSGYIDPSGNVYITLKNAIANNFFQVSIVL